LLSAFLESSALFCLSHGFLSFVLVEVFGNSAR
jgi:hypothetical protein